MKVTIITIGDEILIGQITDTNSSWIAERMTLSGFDVVEIVSIADEEQAIVNCLNRALENSDIVITTGGIGPTKDDITKQTLCKYFGTKLVFSDEVYENVKLVMRDFSRMNELTKNQAYVPEAATIIQNKVGTAPITWFNKDEKVLVSLPGVPYEMRYNVENEIIPRLQKNFEMEAYLKKVYLVAGYTESGLAIHLKDFEENLSDDFGLAYLPSPSIMKLRLFTRGNGREQALEKKSSELEELLSNAIIAKEDIRLESVLGNLLTDKGLTISTAESCTGGNIAHLITSVAGSSAYYEGSIVSYSNQVKINSLNVDAEIIEKHGAVSEEVVLQMAKNIQQKFATDCSIAVSGIAGPSGGTETKPVGTTWICARYRDKVETKLYSFGHYRESNILRATNNAMIQLIRMIQND